MLNHNKESLCGQVAKVMEEMATQAIALASRAHGAEKELKRVQAQLAEARQGQQKAEEEAKLVASQKEAIISGLRAELAEAKKKELNPGEFGEVLINKFLQSQNFYDYALDLCGASMNVGRQDALADKKCIPRSR